MGEEKFIDDIVITLDVDWAPDFVIDAVSDLLFEKRTKATWFVTHDSPGVRRLFERRSLFEIGIHPNFMAGSSQGKDFREVLVFLKTIVPDAKSVRTHGMVYSAEISRLFSVEFGLENDTSVFVGEMPRIIPMEVVYGGMNRILRMPYFWSDDGEMSIKEMPSFSMGDGKFDVPGLKVLCMHPIHIFLNSADMGNYNRLKKEVDIKAATREIVAPFVNKDAGTASLLAELIARNPNEGDFKTLSEIGAVWRSRKRK
jgi:hypothetical protein